MRQLLLIWFGYVSFNALSPSLYRIRQINAKEIHNRPVSVSLLHPFVCYPLSIYPKNTGNGEDLIWPSRYCGL